MPSSTALPRQDADTSADDGERRRHRRTGAVAVLTAAAVLWAVIGAAVWAILGL